MTDAEVVRLFADRESRWHATLRHVEEYHRSHMGRGCLPVAWVGGDALGGRSWFGFYWKTELFWFGYGFLNDGWVPLIEADRRSSHSAVWDTLRGALPHVWRVVDTPDKAHSRLWAGEDVARGSVIAHRDWFLERSRELHEFAVRDH